MLATIRRSSLRFQTIFWITLFSVLSFSALFGINFGYYRSQIMQIQWMQLQALSELVAISPSFVSVDSFVETEENTEQLRGLVTYVNNLITKSGVDGIYILYKKDNEIHQVLMENSIEVVINKNIVLSPEVQKNVEDAFNTSQPVKCRVIDSEIMYNYYILPVQGDYNNSFVICTYTRSLIVEIQLMRYVIINIFSFILVLTALILILVYAVNRILVFPIIEIEKMVDSFVYQVSGGYLTFYFKSYSGNELLILKNSVNRLEKLVGAHNKIMEESGRYTNWLKDNITKLDVENESLLYKLKASQFEALCDRETFTGNALAWKNKCEILDHNISLEKVEFLQVVYLLLDGVLNKQEFIDGAMKAVGIYKGIPMETIFRISLNEFVFVFEDKECPLTLIEYVNDNAGKISYITYDKTKHKCVDDILIECKNKI